VTENLEDAGSLTVPAGGNGTADVLGVPWYAQPNDLIGGWCVMLSDEPPSFGGNEIADFCSEEVARHIAELHNAHLAAAAVPGPGGVPGSCGGTDGGAS
jgi:hypothetical protein